MRFRTLKDKLLRPWRVFRSRGLCGLARRGKSWLWQRGSFRLLWLDLKDLDLCDVPLAQGVCLRRADARDTDAIARAWPEEFDSLPAESDLLRVELHHRFDAGIPCFVACREGTVVGAMWFRSWKHDSALPESLRCPNTVETWNLFVNPSARGLGIAKSLLRTAVAAMVADGKQRCYSRIYPERKASIAVHEKLGFERLGLLRALRYLGRTRYVFDRAPADPTAWPSSASGGSH